MAKDLTAYLAQNPDYITALANLMANLRNKQSQLAFDKGNDQMTYDNSVRNLAQTYQQAKQQNDNSFAARGLMQSGLFVNANNDLNNQQTQKMGDARTAFQNLLDNLSSQQAGAQAGFGKAKQQLDMSAAAKYAAAMGKY